MFDLECLNPKDVLAHLKSLGYNNITPQQLKEFIQDLRKLIKYDQKRMSEIEDEHPLDCDCEHSQSSETESKSAGSESFCEPSNCFFSPSDTYSSKKTIKFGPFKQITKNPTDSEIAEKAQITFIRPWNLQGYRDPSARRKNKRDPVKLYHQYKSFWNQQNIPGETKHLDLRWVIRSRMLGQEPNPRTCLKALNF